MLQSRLRRGLMDKQITLIKKVTSNNSYNEPEETSWIEVSQYPTVWARMMQTKGREVIIADRLTYVSETIFTIDARGDLSVANNRVVYDGVPYNIISIVYSQESRGHFDLICEIVDTEVFGTTSGFTLGFSLGFRA